MKKVAEFVLGVIALFVIGFLMGGFAATVSCGFRVISALLGG